MDSLAFNIASVNNDAAAGRIPKPLTVDDYVAAIVKEYRANIKAVPSGLLATLVGKLGGKRR